MTHNTTRTEPNNGRTRISTVQVDVFAQGFCKLELTALHYVRRRVSEQPRARSRAQLEDAADPKPEAQSLGLDIQVYTTPCCYCCVPDQMINKSCSQLRAAQVQGIRTELGSQVSGVCVGILTLTHSMLPKAPIRGCRNESPLPAWNYALLSLHGPNAHSKNHKWTNAWLQQRLPRSLRFAGRSYPSYCRALVSLKNDIQ